MPKRTVVFRCDASIEIGIGHVARCLVLANSLRNRNVQCSFICRSHQGNLLQYIENNGFAVTALPAAPSTEKHKKSEGQRLKYEKWLRTDWQSDAEQTLCVLDDFRPDWIVVDHYSLDWRWESLIAPRCNKLMVIDDLADRKHICDLLLDQNLVEGFTSRYKNLVPTNATLLLGPAYVLLQGDYLKLSTTPARTYPIRRIMVYFGGADPDNLTALAVKSFLKLNREDLFLDVVISASSIFSKEIKRLVNLRDNITLHEMLPSLAHLMASADFAIGGGGATAWERCCIGLPSVVTAVSANQNPIIEELVRRGVAVVFNGGGVNSEAELAALLLEVLDNKNLEEWSMRCSKLIDGLGSDRVADVVALDASSEITLRRATLDDENLIFRWVNDPLVRRNSVNTRIIKIDSHEAWYSKCMLDEDTCKIYIAQLEGGVPIGQIRFNLCQKNWEIDYSLDSIARGFGLSKAMIRKAIAHLSTIKKVDERFLARVKPDNVISSKIFEALGFKKMPSENGLRLYIC